MTKSSKIALWVFAVLIGLGALAVGGFLYWLEENRDEFQRARRQVIAEAFQFGSGKNNQQCVQEVFDRYPSTSSLMDQAKLTLFLKECLRASRPSTFFCREVPSRDSLLDSALWAISFCEQRGYPADQACTRIVRAIQEYCTEPTRP